MKDMMSEPDFSHIDISRMEKESKAHMQLMRECNDRVRAGEKNVAYEENDYLMNSHLRAKELNMQDMIQDPAFSGASPETIMEQKHLKMYLLVKDDIDVGHAVNSCAHAGMMASLEWPRGSDPVMDEWYEDSFRKCTCKVTEQEFEKAKEYGDFFAVTELAFDRKEVVLVFKPRREWPKFFKFLRLYK